LRTISVNPKKTPKETGAMELGMKQSNRRVKSHIISLRVSNEEWNSLRQIMQGQQFKRVSDLMREAFKMVLTPPSSFGGAEGNRDRFI